MPVNALEQIDATGAASLANFIATVSKPPIIGGMLPAAIGPKTAAPYAPPDITVERTGDLINCDLSSMAGLR
ncbi:MAG: hypothetical protein H7315_01040 [Herminiimonas sp.]|nr:hypothetical protein [Herminiimonas sp.]